MTSTQFNVGDLVAITESNGSPYSPGSQGRIVGKDGASNRVCFSGDERKWYFMDFYLERVLSLTAHPIHVTQVENEYGEKVEYINPLPHPAQVAEDGTVKESVELLPAKVLLQCGAVMGFGTVKYYAGKWLAEPTSTSKRLGSAMRHVLKHLSGEKIDPESGQPHICHAIVQLMMTQEYVNRGIE